MFRYEKDLIDTFLHHIDNSPNNWAFDIIIREFDYKNGKTDILASKSNHLIAFEAKLSKWKKAVNQAYRNTIYANYSYVVLPESTGSTAFQNIDFFQKHGVGLILVNNEKAWIALSANHIKTNTNWITRKAKHFVEKEHGKNTVRISC
jgi:hypothetical protein